MSTARDDFQTPAEGLPQFELRHRMSLALEWAEVGKADMAAHLGTHRNTVSNYLSGRTDPPVPVLRVWALRCGLPYEWLKDGVESGNGTPDGGTSQTACNDDVADVVSLAERRDRSVTPDEEDQAA